MIGHRFINFDPQRDGRSKFEQMLDLFMQLLTYTNGDAGEALQWMNQLDMKHHFTDDQYGMGDFIQDLKDNNYLQEDPADGTMKITGKSEQWQRGCCRGLQEGLHCHGHSSEWLHRRRLDEHLRSSCNLHSAHVATVHFCRPHIYCLQDWLNRIQLHLCPDE